MLDAGSDMKKIGEIVQMVGAIASITGVSLLWLKRPILDNFDNIAFIAVFAALWLAIISIVILVIIELYLRHFKTEAALRKIVFFIVSVVLALLFLGILGLIGNKIVISINWNWFFSSL